MASVFKPEGRTKYVIVWTDENGRRRKKTGASDKRVTEMMARDLENGVALRRQGIVTTRDEAIRDHEGRPLSAHLEDYRAHLDARGGTPKHVDLFSTRARTLLSMARVTRLADLSGSKVQAALADLRREGKSLGTCNHYRAAVRGFVRWAWKDGRLKNDPLVGVSGFNASEDRRHDRRTIGADELSRLIRAAHEGPRYRRMTGPARALVYRLAVASGLRYAELASLTTASFDLGDRPTVTVEAGYAKNGQTATLPIPADLADDLKPYMAGKAPEAPAFPLPGRGADMLKPDLAAAGIPYRDEAGRVFDFHSLRCQLATLADQAGISPRVVQRLMRHSTLELTGRYTRPRALDIEGAAALLPSFRPSGDEPETSRATGTDGTVPRPSATTGATTVNFDASNAIGEKLLASNHERTHKPRVGGSNPSAAISDPPRQTLPKAAPNHTLRLILPKHVRRPLTAGSAPVRPLRATTGATTISPDLAALVAAWPSLPEAIKAGIMAMVEAATGAGS